MNKILTIFALLSFGVFATTYPRLSLEEFNQISDVSVIVKITKSKKSFNDNTELCLIIGYGDIIQSFKGKIKSKSITFNLYSGMEVGDYYHLMLKKSDSDSSYKASTNSVMVADELKIKDKCLSAKKPEHTILMEGLGSTKVDLDVSESLNAATIKYKNNWIVPPESITVKILSSGWSGLTVVRYIDLVKYLKSI